MRGLPTIIEMNRYVSKPLLRGRFRVSIEVEASTGEEAKEKAGLALLRKEPAAIERLSGVN